MKDYERLPTELRQFLDLSPGELKLQKLDRRDKLMRVFEVIVLAGLVVFSVFNQMRLQQIITQNEKNSNAARQIIINQQEEAEGYIKCVLLIRFTHTAADLATKEGASKALDDCATGQGRSR